MTKLKPPKEIWVLYDPAEDYYEETHIHFDKESLRDWCIEDFGTTEGTIPCRIILNNDNTYKFSEEEW